MQIVEGGFCDECSRNVSERIQLGEEPYYESATAYICRDCVEQALAALIAFKAARAQLEAIHV